MKMEKYGDSRPGGISLEMRGISSYASGMNHAHTRAYFLAIVTTLLAALTVYMLRPFLVTVGLAAVFAVMFAPLNGRFQQAGLSRGLAAFATLVVSTVCVAVPLAFLSVQLFHEAENVYQIISRPETLANIQAALVSFGASVDHLLPGTQAYLASLSANLSAHAREGLQWALGNTAAVFSSTFSFLLQFFVFIMTLYYLLKEGPNLRKQIERFSPLTHAETQSLMARLARTINSVVRGSLVIAFIQGALTTVGFLLFGIPNAVLWGTIAVIGALIPSIGTALVIVPGVLYLFFTSHTGAAIGLGLFGLFGVGAVDNVLRPLMVGGNARIHPLLILLSVLGGIALFGPGGIFLGPLVISLLLGLLSLYAPVAREEG